MLVTAAVSSNVTDGLYIVAFSLFIYGLSGLTGPRTAVRGNLIAATGMAVAFIATLIQPHVFDGSSTPWLIALGLVLGTAIGIPAARRVHMTAMPQMVALFNGVGGGAVALIAWTEYRHHFGGDFPLKTEIPSLFAAIVGSISFWGSNIAFGKLQAILPGRPIKLPMQAAVNLSLFVIALGSAIVLAAGTHSQALFILGILIAAAILGNMVVLPIGGADMPVVISLLNAFTGLSAAATGIALNNTAMIVAGMIVGASGTILTNLMAKAMNRSVPAIVAGGFGGEIAAPAGGPETDGQVRSTTADDVAIQLSYAREADRRGQAVQRGGRGRARVGLRRCWHRDPVVLRARDEHAVRRCQAVRERHSRRGPGAVIECGRYGSESSEGNPDLLGHLRRR